ncbi:LysR family transcriptional regulator [Ottowia thiooxydans]|uniref:LysR family transcriptional regulator n=1 Tax=Ottowia thiooxydans TaxID=219182 RepID=UPI0003F67850|nr:LysR family transcriptional regulator [Ottowia thiooxydans]
MSDQAPLFDLNLIRAFVAIYETRSVTQAAERLGLTQPTVSHALSRLRQFYGDRLFARGAHGLIPSAAAERLFEQVNVALSAIEGTFEAQQGFDPGSSTRRFRIATSDIGALFFIPPLLRHLQTVAPKLQAEFVQLSDTVMEELSTGALDLALGNLPNLHQHTREAHVFTERYVCLVSEEHPMAHGILELADFMRARHVMVSSPNSGHALIEGALAQRGIRRNIVALVPQFSVLPSLVEGSDLMVILPERVAGLFASQRKLKKVEIPVALPDFEVRVHWHARAESSPAHRWLREEVIKTLSKL